MPCWRLTGGSFGLPGLSRLCCSSLSAMVLSIARLFRWQPVCSCFLPAGWCRVLIGPSIIGMCVKNVLVLWPVLIPIGSFFNNLPSGGIDLPWAARGIAHIADYGAGRVHSQWDRAKSKFAEPDRRRFHNHGVAILVVDYASQLSFLQPVLLLGETEDLSPWSQHRTR
jgi:hypothetical protein